MFVSNYCKLHAKASISSCFQDLPDTIHIGGRISPYTVWDYVGKLKTSLSKVSNNNTYY